MYKHLLGMCATRGAFVLLELCRSVLMGCSKGLQWVGWTCVCSVMCQRECLSRLVSGAWVKVQELCVAFLSTGRIAGCWGRGRPALGGGGRVMCGLTPAQASHPPAWPPVGQPFQSEGPHTPEERISDCRNCISLTHALGCQHILGSWTESQRRAACGCPGS